MKTHAGDPFVMLNVPLQWRDVHVRHEDNGPEFPLVEVSVDMMRQLPRTARNVRGMPANFLDCGLGLVLWPIPDAEYEVIAQ
jgi:hypothetical protein